MYPSGWPVQVHYSGSVYTYDVADQQAILSALAAAQTAEDQEGWLSVVAYPMDSVSQHKIVEDLYNPDFPLTGLGLWVLAEKISQSALGMTLFASSRLASIALAYWLPFHAWAAKQGLAVANLSTHDLLAAVYGWQASNCSEESEIYKLNRTIFGSKNPWGR